MHSYQALLLILTETPGFGVKEHVKVKQTHGRKLLSNIHWYLLNPFPDLKAEFDQREDMLSLWIRCRRMTIY